MSSKKIKQQCSSCLGSGFIKNEKKKCQICNGNFCKSCNFSGYIKEPPFKECKTCGSSGEIEVKIID
jgi:DnaJ-class molecular chaperone